MNKLLFSAYNVSIEHPKEWQIFINPNSKFSFNDGLAKIDEVIDSQKNPTSLSLRWAKTKEDFDINDYIEEVETQMRIKQNKSKNKDKYEIITKKQYTICGHDAVLIHSRFWANHSIYRFMGKTEQVECLQLSVYCSVTKRIIVASLNTISENLTNNYDLINDILLSVKCH